MIYSELLTKIAKLELENKATKERLSFADEVIFGFKNYQNEERVKTNTRLNNYLKRYHDSN